MAEDICEEAQYKTIRDDINMFTIKRLLFFVLVFAGFCLQVWAGNERIPSVSPSDIDQWRILGGGKKYLMDDQEVIKLTETTGSKGLVLLSREKFPKNYLISFETKPLEHEGVLVFLHSVSDVATFGDINIPDDYDGNWNFWKSSDSDIQSYAVAIHTGFHQPYAFIKKNPGFYEMTKVLDVAKEQRWYHVEIGRKENRLWVKIDGEVLMEADDPSEEGLPAGYFGFRLRGPGDGSFSVLYRNFSMQTLDR